MKNETIQIKKDGPQYKRDRLNAQGLRLNHKFIRIVFGINR